MTPDGEEILVVDDDATLARTVGDILRLHGFESVTASTGAEGLELAVRRADRLPVALVDLRLPDMDGLEVVSRLHEVAELTEVVILTGNASIDSAVAALREDSYDYLLKPVAPEELVDTVRRGVGRWHHSLAEDALRRDRERFQLLVEALSDVITMIGPDGKIQYQSPSGVRTLGFEPGALVGVPFLDHVRPDDRERVSEGLAAAADTPGREKSFEFQFQRADGGWRLLEGVARAVHGRPGTPVVVTCRDVTERRLLEEELQQAQKMESVGRLAGGVAHDFNNQLTAIMSSVDLASWEEDVPIRVVQELSEIRLAAQRAARLTRQLLIFSRKDVSEAQRVDVNQVVRGMQTMLSRIVPATLEIVTDLDPDLPPVFIDPSQLEQVLVNLMVNARDAMGEGRGRATIRTRHRGAGHTDGEDAAPAGEVVLEVQDDGAGMDDGVRARVFEPFFTTKEQGRGTGLGLATCYGIVTRAGGTIRVESELGEGTTVQVVLPARPDAPEAEPRAEETGVRREAQNELILLVEDEDAVRRVVARILERKGYRVISAAHGEEALALLPEGRLHLLLTDLVMPGMSGREVAEAVRDRRPGTPVLFTSGYAGDAPGEAPLPFGADLLPKPIRASELIQRVERALDRGAS